MMKFLRKCDRVATACFAALLMLGAAACSSPSSDMAVSELENNTADLSEIDTGIDTEVGETATDATTQATGAFTDSDIANAIETELNLAEDITFDDVNVAAQDREVTLSGNVDSLYAKQYAEAVAQDVEGVAAVTNDLTVTSSDLSDPQITAAVLEALRAAPELERYEISAETQSGVVRLIGLVETEAEKQQVAAVTSQVTGVQGVQNDVIVESDTAAQ